jgi:hypothetical protein
MKQLKAVVAAFVAAGVLMACVSGFADDKMKKPTNTVNNIRQADPPKASNQPKASPVGQPITGTSKTLGYKPPQKSPESHKIVVPPPAKK